MGGGGMLITLISPMSPVSNRAGESRTFKASVNMDNPIVRWKLDGVLVQAAMNLPANTQMSYTANAVAGIHELKVEAEKNGVLVSKSWTWNVDELISSCSNSYMSSSGNVYVKIKNATLHKRPNGTYSIDIDWYVGACQSIAAGSYNFSPVTYGPACKMIVTVGVYWNNLTYPGAPADNILQQVQETNTREASGLNTFDNVYRECRAFVKVDVECYAHPVVHLVTPEGELNVPILTEIVTAAKENGYCACSL
ncbi:MAG TPA: hypothetical protein DCG34_03140 [Clostridiales bacterium]|nr:hypothetical protein [Methanomethylovorans sp.]HAE41898.1 hypothetical protein [Clostridiales bacterium]